MHDQERLKISRDSYKSSLKIARGELDEFIEERNFVGAEMKLDILNGLVYKLETINSTMLETAVDEVVLKEELEEEKALLTIKCELASTLRSINVGNRPDSSPTNQGNVEKDVGARIKLPVLHVPKYSGDYTEFISWFEQYSSSIHNNPRLNDIDKFAYL